MSMFNLFRRRGRSSKERNQQTKNVANLEEIATNVNVKASSSGEDLKTSTPHSDAQPQRQGASASDSKVILDSTTHSLPPAIPQRRVAAYRQCGDGVVVSEISTDSRNEGADQQRQRSDNDTADDRDRQDQSASRESIQSENPPPPPLPPARPEKSKSQAANRRSIFFRHFQSPTPAPPIEQRYRQLDEDQVSPPTVQEVSTSTTPPPTPPRPPQPLQTPVPAEASAKPKRFNPLEKGRDFFNEILMAKGRHRNNRSHHHKGGGGSISGVRQGPKPSPQQEPPKKSPAEPAECIPEPPGRLQNDQVTEESINTADRHTPDVSVAAALTNAISVLSSVTAYKCADSSVKNSPHTAQSPRDEQAESTAPKLIADATKGESSTDDQTVDECAPQQVPSENASRDQNIEAEEEAEDRVSTTTQPNVGEDPARSLAELTECDRDQITVNKMGQSQAKPEPPSARAESRSPSPKIREFRESRIEGQKPPAANLPQLIVPEIVVEDFGNVASQTGDVFYDVETSQSPLDDHIEEHLLKVPDEEECGPDEEDNDDGADEEEDQWHFINSAKETDDQHCGDYDHESGTTYPKAENSSDSNLSTSDSGIATTEQSAKVLHLESCDLVNDSGRDPSAQGFRDGSATDCDESLPPCDNFDYYRYRHPLADSVVEISIDEHDSQNGILIESISLPDVVVESTSACAVGFSKSSTSDSAHTGHGGSSECDDVDSSDSVRMGNIHFIPIRVEKRRSVDDSVLMSKSANGGNILYNGQQYHEEKSTLEITPEEDEQEVEAEAMAEAEAKAEAEAESEAEAEAVDNHPEDEEKMRDLVDQESRFSKQLDDAQKNIYNLESKITELQSKIDDLEKELSVKSWNVDRLQGELGAAHKEDECVRRRLRLLEEEKVTLRQKYNETEEELNSKYDDLETQYKDLEEKYKETQSLYTNLQAELANAQSDVEKCQQETEKLREEKDEQIRILEEALAAAKQEQQAMQIKWQKEFETLRTQNADREEHLMSDCEWQLRQMQKTCKEKLDKAEHQRRQAVEQSEKMQQEVEEKVEEVLHLKYCEAEVKQLRGLTADQENSIKTMQEQIEALRADLVTANETLEEQIECVRRIKYQCDNAIYDKEREVLQRIDEVRNEAASLWERKLITEMTRLKMELESVYADDRREELDKLQAEHIEELKALTTRYTANEEELRAEIAELRESLERRNEEFIELREKSDNAILQTRMHLDRADRDYQTAMCREEEKREKLAESLREEFEAEKLEMEEKFRERLSQVQDEFSKELQMSTQELTEKHHKELEQQWQKLIAEKEEAIQELEARHRKKLENAENRLHDTETRHQHDLKDLKSMYDTEKAALDKRDMSNVNEIEQLHRKCRCLTNLFDEMRMRYERRDPRPEDIREIAELRSRCEAQERDLYELTDRLREMQIQMEELQSGGNKKKSQVRKPPPKVIPTNCDVIYEENEERDSPPPPQPLPRESPARRAIDEEQEEEEDDEEDSDGDDDEEEDDDDDKNQYQKNTINDDDDTKKIIDGDKKRSLNDLQTMNNFNQIIEAEEC